MGSLGRACGVRIVNVNSEAIFPSSKGRMTRDSVKRSVRCSLARTRMVKKRWERKMDDRKEETFISVLGEPSN